jgi:ADP-heptose:LPS heptosyltransferase
VIAPSTGVLHLAASLGTVSVGIYSPRRVEHPRRWGPKGIHTVYLVPQVAETDMISPEIMKQITVAQVLEAVRNMEERLNDSEAQPRV